MATYFEFNKKHPHINYDDVYIKHGEVKDDKLVLEYSIEGINPLSIDIPRGGSGDYKNALSDMNFITTDEKSILSIAQAVEQIITAFGGNKQNK